MELEPLTIVFFYNFSFENFNHHPVMFNYCDRFDFASRIGNWFLRHNFGKKMAPEMPVPQSLGKWCWTPSDIEVMKKYKDKRVFQDRKFKLCKGAGEITLKKAKMYVDKISKQYNLPISHISHTDNFIN